MPCLTIPIDPNFGALISITITQAKSSIPQGGGPPRLKNLRALIDTGASTTCLAPHIAKHLDLKVLSKKPMATAAGVTEANIYLVDVVLPLLAPGQTAGMAIGVPDLQVAEVHLPEDGPYGALLGMDVITRGLFQIVGSDKQFTICM